MEIFLSIAIGLISMLGYGFANAFSQPLSRSLGAAQVLFLRGFTLVGILLILSLPGLMHGPNMSAIFWTFILGLLGYLPVLAFTHGIKISRLGVVAPIAGTSPLITVLMAFIFLGTVISPLQWLAIVVIIIANIVVSIDLKNWRDSSLLKASSGIPFAIIATVGWGLFFFFFISSANALGPWISALVAEIGVTTAAGLHIWLTKKPLKFRDAGNTRVMLNAALICIGTAAFTFGVSYYNVGIVVALSNSTSLVAALLGTYLFHEHLTTKEKIAGALMIAGVATIALA